MDTDDTRLLRVWQGRRRPPVAMPPGHRLARAFRWCAALERLERGEEPAPGRPEEVDFSAFERCLDIP